MPVDQKIRKFLPLTPLRFQILTVLGEQDRHGYGIITELRSRVEDFDSATGPVYLALRRIEEEGLIREVPPPRNSDRRRKHYSITDLGRRVAREDAARLSRLLGLAINSQMLFGVTRS